MALVLLLLSPVLVMAVGSRLVDFGRTWPPRLAVLVAAAAPVVIAITLAQSSDAITAAAAFYVAPVFAFYGLIVGGFTYAIVRPR